MLQWSVGCLYLSQLWFSDVAERRDCLLGNSLRLSDFKDPLCSPGCLGLICIPNRGMEVLVFSGFHGLQTFGWWPSGLLISISSCGFHFSSSNREPRWASFYTPASFVCLTGSGVKQFVKLSLGDWVLESLPSLEMLFCYQTHVISAVQESFTAPQTVKEVELKFISTGDFKL